MQRVARLIAKSCHALGAAPPSDHQDPAVVVIGDGELDRGSVRGDELVGLTREDAREDELAVGVDERGQERRQQLERRGQDVGDD